MSPSMAACARCGHVFSDDEALDPCPACGGSERTLRRDALVLAQDDSGSPTEIRQVEQRRPDGSVEVREERVERLGVDAPTEPSSGR